jgi:hypothetical protein
MIYSYDSEIKLLETKILDLKEKRFKEREKFLSILEQFPDGKIKSWGLNLKLVKNKLITVNDLYRGEIKPYLFSSSAMPLMKDFWFLAKEDFNYHTRVESTEYFLIPFCEQQGYTIFADFGMLEISECDWWSAKRNDADLCKLIRMLKEKNLCGELIEKLLQILKNEKENE